MKAIIEAFYTAFTNMDAEKMVSYYHDDIVFEDPAFGVLKGEHAKNMWRMLIASQKGKKFLVRASDFRYANHKGFAHWEAQYKFSQTGRQVHNIIEAAFEFENGKIIKHTDSFDLHRWAKQAVGFKGYLLGRTAFFKKKLQEQAGRLLMKYEERSS